jgi:hypothetical protein
MYKKGLYFAGVWFLLIFIALINSVCATQEMISVVYCNVSLNDYDFGAWDPSTNRGVFLNLYNNNWNVKNSVGSFIYKNMKDNGQRGFYNSFSSGGVSGIPVINVGPQYDNKLYVRCAIKSLIDSRISIYKYEFPSRAEELLTSDFNLTKSIISSSGLTVSGVLSDNLGDFSNSKYTLFYSNGFIKTMDGGFERLLFGSLQGGDWKQYSPSTQYPLELNPREQIEVTSGLGLTTLNSGFVSSILYVTGNGFAILYDGWDPPNSIGQAKEIPVIAFYVNSSFRNEGQQLSSIVKNLQPNLVANNAIYTHNGVNYSFNSGSDFLLKGDKLIWNVSWSNPYTWPIYNLTVVPMMYSSPWGGIGFLPGEASDVVTGESNFYGEVRDNSFNVSYTAPGETKNLLVTYDFYGSDALFDRRYDYSVVYFTLFGFNSSNSWFVDNRYLGAASSGFPFMGFGLLESKIGLDSSSGTSRPSFIINLSLLYPPYSGFSFDPKTYLINFSVYNSQKKEEVVLNQLRKVDISNSTPFGATVQYSYAIPIDDTSIFNPGKTYLFDAVLIYNGTNAFGKNLSGKRIAAIMANPSIKSGESLYLNGSDLAIGPTSWPSKSSGVNKTFFVFNPSLYLASSTLSLSNFSWNINVNDSFKKQVHICLSDKGVISDFSDCLLEYRYPGSFSNYSIGTFKPLESKKYFLHAYCDGRNAENCSSVLESGMYGYLNFKAFSSNGNYSLSIPVRQAFNVCGDGLITSTEECDFINGVKINNTYCQVCVPKGFVGECSCTIPGNGSIFGSSWVNSNGSRGEFNFTKADSLGMIASLYNFAASINPSNFSFRIYKVNGTNYVSYSAKSFNFTSFTNETIDGRLNYASEFISVLKAIGENISFGDKFYFKTVYSVGTYLEDTSNQISLVCAEQVDKCSSISVMNQCDRSCFSPLPNSMNLTCSSDVLIPSKGQCGWVNGICMALDTHFTGSNPGVDSGYCNYDYSIDSICSDNLFNITGKGTYVGSLSGCACPDILERISCDSSKYELPFFGVFEFISALLSIFLIYLLRKH